MAKKQVKQEASKIPHPNIKKTKTETGGPLVMGEYKCQREFLPRPITKTFIESIAQELIEWANEDTSLHITNFYQKKGMPKTTFYDWVEKDPSLKEAHVYAIDALGARREVGAITKKYDTGAIWKRQYQFGEEYKAAMIFASMLAKKEDENAGNKEIKVFMTDMCTMAEMTKNNEGGANEDTKL